MLNLHSILLFSQDPVRLTDFYQQVFQQKPVWSEGEYTAFQVGDGILTIGPHDKVKGKNTMPARCILNYETSDVDQEFERIKSLGATVIAAPYHPMEDEKATIATFADPDENYFQLATPFGDVME